MAVKLSVVDPRPLEFFDTYALLAELHTRGRLKDVYTQAAINYRELDRLKDDTGYLDHVKRSLAVQLGNHLFDSGFVLVEEKDDDLHMYKYIRMRVLAVTVPQPPPG